MYTPFEVMKMICSLLFHLLCQSYSVQIMFNVLTG